MYRIGIDVGGTNTDAVVMQDEKVLLGVKKPTTEDVMTGVINSLEKLTKEKNLMAFKHNGFWKCVDTLKDKLYLDEIYKKNKKKWTQ